MQRTWQMQMPITFPPTSHTVLLVSNKWFVMQSTTSNSAPSQHHPLETRQSARISALTSASSSTGRTALLPRQLILANADHTESLKFITTPFLWCISQPLRPPINHRRYSGRSMRTSTDTRKTPLPFVLALIHPHPRYPQALHHETSNASSRTTRSVQATIAVLSRRQTCLSIPTSAGCSLPSQLDLHPNALQMRVTLMLKFLTHTPSTFTSTVSAHSQVTRQRHSCPPTGRRMQFLPLNNRLTQLSLFTSILLAST